MSLSTNTRIAITLALLTFAALAGVVHASAGDSPADRAEPAKLTFSAGSYSVFARAASAGDDLDGWRLPPNAEGELGLNRALARVVYRDSGRTVAAVPTHKGPCLAQRFADGAGGLNCGGPDRPTIVLGYHGAVGLMPDSVHELEFTLTDGRTVREDVANNVWHSPVEASSVTYVLDGTSHSIELMPRSSLPQNTTLRADGYVTGS